MNYYLNQKCATSNIMEVINNPDLYVGERQALIYGILADYAKTRYNKKEDFKETADGILTYSYHEDDDEQVRRFVFSSISRFF